MNCNKIVLLRTLFPTSHRVNFRTQQIIQTMKWLRISEHLWYGYVSLLLAKKQNFAPCYNGWLALNNYWHCHVKLRYVHVIIQSSYMTVSIIVQCQPAIITESKILFFRKKKWYISISEMFWNSQSLYSLHYLLGPEIYSMGTKWTHSTCKVGNNVLRKIILLQFIYNQRNFNCYDSYSDSP